MENSSRFFENKNCKFYPCHSLDGDFNCLFCYCPLYSREVCPGNPTFLKKNDGSIVKRCTDCNFPHKPENYERIMNLLRVSKNEIEFSEYHHGGEEKQENSSDFSVNINPLGLSENVKRAIQDSVSSLAEYPDSECVSLRKKIAKNIINPDFIVCGNGASELITLVSFALSPKNALILAPGFSGYEKSLKSVMAKVHYHLLRKENDFILDESIFESIEKANPELIFLCSPNNPTGLLIKEDLLKKIAEICDEKGIFLVVDECFLDFTGYSEKSMVNYVNQNQHLIVLNAFTKTYALAGLRLGWIVTSNQALLKKINFILPEWNVSLIAQKAGEKALEDSDYLEKSRKLIQEERDFLSKELKALGYNVYKSDANFILFEDSLKNNMRLTENLDNYLKKNGIFIRNCGNFHGLSEDFFRIAVRTHFENEKLINALKNRTQKSGNK